jgi:hypothetical protein
MVSNRWFVTAKLCRTSRVDDVVVVVPVSWAHAKTMGTTRTACGQECSSWTKIWDATFPSAVTRNCPECLRIADAE